MVVVVLVVAERKGIRGDMIGETSTRRKGNGKRGMT